MGSNDLIGSVISTNLTKSLSNSLLNANPDLQSLAQNGGPTETMALLADSPAINAGANGLAVDPITQKALMRDQTDINERIQGGTVDIGAYESSYVSTSTGLTSLVSNDTSTYGTSVTFTATVSDIDLGWTPTGSVAFYDGTTDLGAGTAKGGPEDSRAGHSPPRRWTRRLMPSTPSTPRPRPAISSAAPPAR